MEPQQIIISHGQESLLMKPAEKEWLVRGTMVLLTAALFVLDIYTPLSFANHILYATVVLVATASRVAAAGAGPPRGITSAAPLARACVVPPPDDDQAMR